VVVASRRCASASSCVPKYSEGPGTFGVRSPLWTAHTIIVDPKKPRTDEVVGFPHGHRFVSVLGAAWLLMVLQTCAWV